MLGKIKLMGAGVAVLATVAMSMPADAQWRRHYPRHHHRDRIDGGDVLLGAIIAGGIIALASSADKSRRERDRQDDIPPPPVDRPGPYVGPQGDDAAATGGEDAPDAPVEVSDEDSAVDSCAAAAEDEGRALARMARVTDIGGVDRSGNGWTVSGTVELSEGYRGQRRTQEFTCAVARGGAPDVRIDGGRYSAR